MRAGIAIFIRLMSTLCILGQTMPSLARQSFAEFPQKSGAALGMGWRIFDQTLVLSSCVDFGKDEADQRTLETQYTEVSDRSSLMEAFSLSAEAKASSLMGGGGGSASFSRSVKLDTYGLNIAVYVQLLEHVDFTVPPGLGTASLKRSPTTSTSPARAKQISANELGPLANTIQISSQTPVQKDRALVSYVSAPRIDATGIRAIRLTDDAATLAYRDPVLFSKTCGDGFVSAIRYGSGIQGVMVIATKSIEEYQDLSGKVSGSYGAYSASVEGSQKMHSLQSEHRLAIHYIQLGGDSLPISPTYDAFTKAIQDIGNASPANGGSPFEVGITPYRDLPNFPGDGAGISVIERMANEYFRLQSLDDLINDVLADTEYYYDSRITRDSVKATQDAIRNDMKELSAANEACSGLPNQCKPPPQVDLQDYRYRAMLPVKKSALSDVVKAEADAANAQDTLNKTPQKVGNEACGRTIFQKKTFCTTTYADNPKYPIASLAAASTKKVLNDLLARRDTADERYNVWIQLPSLARCINRESDVCLNNGQLEAIYKQMHAAPQIASVNSLGKAQHTAVILKRTHILHCVIDQGRAKCH